MRIKGSLLLIIPILLWQTGSTQNSIKANQSSIDTTTLKYAIVNGNVLTHLRNFTSVTNNASGLSDYYAIAIGGNLKYESAHFKKFQFGISGSLVNKVAASDLTVPDPVTKQWNRYEAGLFDVEDPTANNLLFRLS